MSDVVIALNKATKRFVGMKQNAVSEVTLDIDGGSFVTILGTSGSGKTTLLKLVNRIHELTAGEILFNGQNIHELKVEEYRKKIGYVIQQIGLFPHMTVAENIAVVPESLKWNKNTIEERVDYLLELVHLNPAYYRNRYPAQLSGGQQQRVGLARAMAAEPGIMLMDEPFGAIDSITRKILQDELLAIHKKLGKTILFVTHDIHEALKLGGKVIVMDDGKVQQYDTPYNILFRPANAFVSRLVAAENTLEKLQVLRVGAVASPARHSDNPNIPRVNEAETLSNVLAKFMETGAPYLGVTDDSGRVNGEVSWDALRSVASLRNEGMEYYV
ncbi:MAG: ABC transporter ATP-binding protein [Synergistaceae bacterium]|jgi:osmoprotectant transport system ATP-binding protein|nr:ABC transporter ATP-binding protein [Synergistaceae bacterium]